MTAGGAAAPLRGRDAELGLLRSRLAAASQDGRGCTVVVSGEPGSGKSRMLLEVRLLAERIGARVLDVVGDPDEDVIPHGPVLQAVQTGPDPLLDRAVLARLPPGADQGWWLRQELQSRLQQVAMQRPVVVCVDDLQWCGSGALWLLRTLPPLLSTDAVVWVVAVRSGSSDPAVAATLRSLTAAGAERLDLRPLDGDAVALLVGDVLGAVPDDEVLRSAARAEGHPLLLVELLRGWLDEGLVQVDRAGARLSGQVMPARLLDAVERRTERLSPVARQLLQMGAVLGRHFPPDLLAAMLDRPPPAVFAPLQEVVAAGLLHGQGEELAFAHDLIREAVAAGIPTAMGRALRRHAAAVLLARGAPALQVATLLAESASPGDLDAVAALRGAASTLASTASPAAARFSLRALELLPEDSPLRPELVVEAIRHLWECGRLDDAEQLASTMLTGAAGGDHSAEALVRLELARFTTLWHEAIGQCRTALALPGLDAALRRDLRLTLAKNHAFAGEADEAGAVLDQVRSELGDALDAATSADLARAESYAAFHTQQWDHAFARHEDVVRTGAPGVDHNPPRSWEAMLWALVGHPVRCLQIVDADLGAERRRGRLGSLMVLSSMRARALMDAGRLAESRAEAEAVLDLEETQVDGGLMDLLVVYSLVRSALHGGWPDVVQAHWGRVEQMTAHPSGHIRRNGLWLTALAAHAAGDDGAALRAAAEAIATLDRPTSSFGGWPDLADEVVLVRMALGGGQESTAVRAVEAAERRAGRNPGYPVAAALALQARGLLTGDTACLHGAVRLLNGSERPLLLASAREDLAAAVAGRPREAIGLLDDALLAYGTAGAEHDAARARRRLRDLGVRRRRTPGAPGRRDGFAGLTPTEREVVGLVAQGLTNAQVATRLYVSPHTVNTHLRNAFVKLGVQSRVELARLVAARGDTARS